MDAHDRRFVKKEGSTVIEHYIWNYENQLKAITDQSGVITKAFVYGTKTHVPDYMITSTGDFQIVTDHLGSPVVVVNAATGEVVQEIRYDSFGKVVADTNPGFIPFGYAGCLYDQDTKLCRFGARDYDASIGRWTAKDPILFAGGDTNLYGYVMQDPINLIDPSGLKSSMSCENGNDANKVTFFVGSGGSAALGVGGSYSGGFFKTVGGTSSEFESGGYSSFGGGAGVESSANLVTIGAVYGGSQNLGGKGYSLSFTVGSFGVSVITSDSGLPIGGSISAGFGAGGSVQKTSTGLE